MCAYECSALLASLVVCAVQAAIPCGSRCFMILYKPERNVTANFRNLFGFTHNGSNFQVVSSRTDAAEARNQPGCPAGPAVGVGV